MAVETVLLDVDAPPDRARYDRLHDACPRAFVQQSTAWCDVIRPLGPDRPLFLLATRGGEDLAGLPLYLFEHPHGNVLGSVPHLGPLGGVFARPGLDEATRREAYAALLDAALALGRQHGCLSFSLITNPFAPDDHLYRRHREPDYVLENFTQYLDPADPHARYTRSRRVQKALALGYAADVCRRREDFEAWYALHAERHQQIGVTPIDVRHLAGIYDRLIPAGKAQLVLVKLGDEVASGCFYVWHREVMDVLILSVHPAHMAHSPNYLTVEHSLAMAKALGIRTYNWQSAPSRASGVYEYKRQWGSREALYYYLTWLFVPPTRFERLGLDLVREAYKLHFTVPYQAFATGFDTKAFRKE